MNVLHLIHNLEREGAQVVLLNIASGPHPAQDKHVVCAWKRGGPLKSTLEERGISVYVAHRPLSHAKTAKKIHFLSMLSTIQDIIRLESIQLIHAHMSDAAFIGAVLSKRVKIPMVVTHHSNKLTPSSGLKSFFWYGLLLWTSTATAKHIAISASVGHRLKQKLRLSDERLTIVTNGVRLPTQTQITDQRKHVFNPKTAPLAFPLRGKPVIVAVGRLVHLKGFKQLIQASKQILCGAPQAQIFILGDGPLKATLQQQIDHLNIAHAVTLAGATDNVPAWLAQADVFVSTSHYEGIPMATLEAMAWKIPVVASDVVGTRDIVHDTRTGLLYRLHDIQDLAEKVRQTLDNGPCTASRIHNARQMVTEKFSAPSMNTEYRAIYQKVLG